jgi:hypothetical protein
VAVGAAGQRGPVAARNTAAFLRPGDHGTVRA